MSETKETGGQVFEDGNKTARELVTDRKHGRIVYDKFDEGVRFIVLSLHSHFTAYVGIPLPHPLAGKSYEDLSVDCHGGLTFSGKGKGIFPSDFWWYGWDYAHYGDFNYYGCAGLPEKPAFDEKDWTLKEVIDDSWSAIYNFKKLLKLSEQIHDEAMLKWKF